MAPIKTQKGEKYFVDASGPVGDGIFDIDAFEKFLHDSIKVEGKAGQLGDAVAVSRQGEGRINVVTNIPFSKRYIKYLTKKFLKRQQLRDWLRVVASNKNGYVVKFFNVSAGDEEEEEDA